MVDAAAGRWCDADMVVPGTPPRSAGTLTLTRTQARVIWFAFGAGLVACVVATIIGAPLVPAMLNPQNRSVFLLVAGVLVPVDLAVSFFVISRLRKQTAPGAAPDALAGKLTIVGSAVALGASLMCCVFFFVAREPLLLALVVPCAGVLLHWFPSQARWEALSVPPAPGAPPRNPMVRG